MKSILTIAKLGFWLIFFILTYLFLVPGKFLAGDIFDWWDKLQHSLAFGVLSILGLIAYSSNQAKSRRLLLALTIYGALIEILQSLLGWRYGEFQDWLADLVGIVIAWGVFLYIQNHPQISLYLNKN